VRQLHEIADAGPAVIMATHNLQLVEQYPSRVVRCENKMLIDSTSIAQN
jgi:cell division transport system ATP-binding protein